MEKCRLSLLLVPALLTILISCSSGAVPSSAPAVPSLPETSRAEGLPAPSANESGTDPTYKLVPGDSVLISVYGESELTASDQIANNGTIRLPLLIEVKLSGMSVREAARYLEKLYVDREILKNPMVTISVNGFAGRDASVLGAVHSPGHVTFPQQALQVDIVDFITRAGGFLPTAKSDAVKVYRRVPSGEDTVFTLDVQAMISGRQNGRKQSQFFVQPDDRIWVPERLF